MNMEQKVFEHLHVTSNKQRHDRCSWVKCLQSKICTLSDSLLFPETKWLKTRIVIVLKIRSESLRTFFYNFCSTAILSSNHSRAMFLLFYLLFLFFNEAEAESSRCYKSDQNLQSPSAEHKHLSNVERSCQRDLWESAATEESQRTCSFKQMLLYADKLSEVRPMSHGQRMVDRLQMSRVFSIIKNSSLGTSLSLRD